MPIIETLYQLTERDTSKVNVLWKELQIIGYAVASVGAFIACFSFYKLLSGFSMNCILYTEVQFRELKAEDKNYKNMLLHEVNVTIDSIATNWNRDIVCQFCLLVWTMSFVGGIILATFFILHPKGGKGYIHSIFSQPWKMVIPVLGVSLFMAILTSTASVSAVSGINSFCAAFQNYTGNESCSSRADVFTLKFHDSIHPIYTLVKMVKSGTFISFIAWIFCVVLLLIRLCLAPDFTLQIINIVPNEKSYIQTKKMYSEPSVADILTSSLGKIEKLSISSGPEDIDKLNQSSNSNELPIVIHEYDESNKSPEAEKPSENLPLINVSQQNDEENKSTKPDKPNENLPSANVSQENDKENKFTKPDKLNEKLPSTSVSQGIDESNNPTKPDKPNETDDDENIHSPHDNDNENKPSHSNNNDDDNNPPPPLNNVENMTERLKKGFFKML